MFAIRARTEEDLAACGEIIIETRAKRDGYPVYLPGDPVDFLRHGHEIASWVATSDDHIVGHVALHAAVHDPVRAAATSATGLAPEQLAVASRLFVAETARRAGLGAMLLLHATDAALSKGLQPVLDVVKTLTPAIALYERCGWQRAGQLTYRWSTGSVESWLYVAPAPPASV